MVDTLRGTIAVRIQRLGLDWSDNSKKTNGNEMLKNGVIVRPFGTCLAICPPLVITDDEIGRLLDTMESALK